jgi:hypothetical protein
MDRKTKRQEAEIKRRRDQAELAEAVRQLDWATLVRDRIQDEFGPDHQHTLDATCFHRQAEESLIRLIIWTHMRPEWRLADQAKTITQGRMVGNYFPPMAVLVDGELLVLHPDDGAADRALAGDLTPGDLLGKGEGLRLLRIPADRFADRRKRPREGAARKRAAELAIASCA